MACVPISIAVDMVQAMSGGAMIVTIAAPPGKQISWSSSALQSNPFGPTRHRSVGFSSTHSAAMLNPVIPVSAKAEDRDPVIRILGDQALDPASGPG